VKAQFLVLTNPVAGKEADFHRWYDETHLREVCEVPGVVSAVRVNAVPGEPPAYLSCAIYTIDAPVPLAVVEEVKARWRSGRFTLTDAMEADILMQLYA